MLNHTKISFRHLLFLCLIVAVAVISLRAQTANGTVRYGRGLSEHGSDKPAFAIFTNPAQDCSRAMNISWATPPGVNWLLEVTEVLTGNTYVYDFDEEFLGGASHEENEATRKLYKFPYVYRCSTFDNIPSRLYDDRRAVEKHLFDKHGYEIFDLDPDTEYSYRIITIDPDTDEKEYSEPRYFHTAGARAWKAAVIGDFHHYSPLWNRIEAAMGMLDVIDSVSGGVDWVLSTGDQCAYGGSFNMWTELSEQPGFQDFMWASVQGNHDNMASNKVTSDNFFRDSHYFPYNGYEGQEGVTYWFRYGDVLFLMLNNETLKSSEDFRRASEWMERVAEENPSRYIIVVEHNQWLHGTDGKMSVMELFYKTFDRMGVDLAISGHNHVYLRTASLRNLEAVEPGEGTYYVVNASSDNSRGRDVERLSANSDLIEKRWSEGAHTVGGMLMDVNPTRIEMTLYNRYGEVEDSFTVPARR